MPPRRISLPALAVALGAACALWVSAGALTIAGAGPSAPRVGVLPSFLWLTISLGIALLAVFVTRRSAILVLSALVFLPWLPFRIPLAALAWTGPLRLWLWTLITVELGFAARREKGPYPFFGRIRRVASDPRSAPCLAAVLAFCAYLAGAWFVFPHLPAGDEPHYLVITQSLLEDHDIQIENNHRQDDYRAYYPGPLKPDFLRRGRNGEIYSIHAPGLAVLVAPVFALGGYPAVIIALALLGGCATALAWIAAWRVTHHVAASWFGWAAVALSVPFFFQAFVVLPDGVGAAIVIAATLAMLAGRDLSRGRLLATGAALAALPWLHTRFALLAAVLSALILARNLGAPDFVRRAAALLAVPIVSAAAWFSFFYVIYGTLNPAAPYGGYTQSGIANLPRGVSGLLFDQQFGVMPNAPVYLCAALGSIALARRAPRLLIELLLVIVPYSLSVAAYQMWWAGYSSPARFIVPIVLPLAIPAAVWFAQAGRGARMYGLGALLVSILITASVSVVGRGALLYSGRDGASRWLLWISPLVDLTTGVPSLFQNPPRVVLGQAAIWAALVSAAVAIGLVVARRGASAQVVALAGGAALALAGMISVSLVWRTNNAAPLTPATASIDLLRRVDPDSHQIALRYSPLRRVAIENLPPMIPLLVNDAPAAASAVTPLLQLESPPAATYEIEAVLNGAGAGRVSALSDRDLGPLWRWDLPDGHGIWRQRVTLPLAVPLLAIDADTAARRAIDRIAVTAVSVPGSSARLTNAEPAHAVRYGPALVFLLDGDAYVEREGAWISGGRSARFAIVPDAGAPIRLFVRNAPVQNDVTLDGGAWRQTLSLRPREERMIDVPVAAARLGAVLRVTTSAGSRPSDLDPSTTDRRMLGCWIETR
jgi:hypothetical protein